MQVLPLTSASGSNNPNKQVSVDVWNAGHKAMACSDRTALQALATEARKLAFLGESGREGLFQFSTSNLSTQVTADTSQAIYVAPSSDTTGASGAWVRQFTGAAKVGWWGAVGDGTVSGGGTDDTTALQNAVTYCKANSLALEFDASWKSYRITSANGLWFGKADPSTGMRGFDGKWATLYLDVDDGVGLDLVGIPNGEKAYFGNVRVTTCTGRTARHGVVQGRPAKATGTYSSGRAHLDGIYVTGAYHGAAYYNVASESNFHDNSDYWNDLGAGMFFTRFDYFRDTFRMPFDGQTAAFTESPNNILTGAASGATAKILRVGNISGNAGVLFCKKVSGTFADNETITSTNGGSATSNIPSGYTVIGKASPNVNLDMVGITSVLQEIGPGIAVYLNSTEGLFSPLTIMGWNDIVVGTANLNMVNLSTGEHCSHVEISSDRSSTDTLTPDAPDSGTPSPVAGSSGIVLRSTFFHAVHTYSVRIGDPCATHNQNYTNIQIVDPGFGATSTARIKCFGGSGANSLYSPTFDVYGNIDLGAFSVYGNAEIRMRGDSAARTLTSTGDVLEGKVYCRKVDTVSLSATAGGRYELIYTDLPGISRKGYNTPSTTIAGGAFTVTHPLMRVIGEGSAADDLVTINQQNNAVPHGQLIGLRADSSAYLITIKNTGNIVTANATDWILHDDVFTFLMYDAQLSKWHVVPGMPRLAAPADPSGGATIDTEARAAIGLIIDSLQSAGIYR